MKILRLLSLIFVISCSTSGKKKNGLTNIDSIEDSDFKAKKQITYSKNNDVFKIEDGKDSAFSGESLAVLSSGIQDDLHDSKDSINRIASLCHTGEFEEAFDQIKSSYSSYKKNPSFYNQIGTCFLLKNELRKAQLYYNKSISIRKDYAPSLNNLGVIYLKQGNVNKATVAFKKAIKYAHFTKTPKFNLANIYLRNGISSKAQNYLLTINRSNSKDVSVKHALAMGYLIDGKYSKANQIWSSIDDEYERFEVGLNYSYSLFKANQKEKAKDVFSDLDESNQGAWANQYNKIKSLLE